MPRTGTHGVTDRARRRNGREAQEYAAHHAGVLITAPNCQLVHACAEQVSSVYEGKGERAGGREDEAIEEEG